MATPQEIHDTMRKAALDAYLEEYKQLKETWRSIETKAQGSIAVSGIFIAGALAFMTKADAHLRCPDKILLSIGLVCLIISVILAILVLRTQVTTVPPLGRVVGRYAVGMITEQAEEDLVLHTNAFFHDVASKWEGIILEVSAANKSKADRLWLAQLFLIFAIIAVAVLSILKLFT